MTKYFEIPIVWDYLILTLINIILCVLVKNNFLLIPEEDFILSMTSDISNIGFTSAGFVLTFLTLLITFKGSSTTNKNSSIETHGVFDLFLATDLYDKTITHLKNAVKSLVLMAIVGYSFKLLLNPPFKYIAYYFNISGVFLASITLWRCLIILTKILNIQKK
jgi:hypothetical protein